MSILVNDNFECRAPKHLDKRSGPFASVAAANAAILPAYRVIGLKVLILEDGSAVEYWYKDGTGNSDLILKDGGGGSNYTLPAATVETLGGVKVGEGLAIDEEGNLSAISDDSKADLVGGKVPIEQLPATVIGESFTVASQAAMLALTAQVGDVAIRTDQANTKYLLLGNPATLSSWSKMIATPISATDISQDATHRFVTDAEKSIWNAGGGGGGLTWTASALGIVGDGETDQTDNINAALLITNTIYFDSKEEKSYVINGIVNATGKRFKFEKGNVITGTGTVQNLSISCAPDYQCFESSITLTGIKNVFSVMWYGAKGDGVTDDLAAINKTYSLLNGNINLRNFTIFFPDGTFNISNEIIVPNSVSWHTTKGLGKRRSIIKWTKVGDGGDILRFTNAQFVTVEDLEFRGNDAGIPDRVINFYRHNPKVGDVGNIYGTTVRRVFASFYYGKFRDGICFTCGTVNDDTQDDQNNEQGNIIDCQIEWAERFGIAFQHRNALWHNILRGNISGGVASITNKRVDAGAEGTSGGGFTATDVVIMSPTDTSYQYDLVSSQYPIIINGHKTETGKRVLRVRKNTDLNIPIDCIVTMNNPSMVLSPVVDNFDIDGLDNKVTINDPYIYGSPNFKVGGATLVINGGVGNIASISCGNGTRWQGRVYMNNYKADGGIGFIDTGYGSFHIKDGSKNGGNSVRYTGAGVIATPDVTAVDMIGLNASDPITITDFTGGYETKEFTLIPETDNITISGFQGISTPTGGNVLLKSFTSYKFIMMNQAYGSHWVMQAGIYDISGKIGNETDSYNSTAKVAQIVSLTQAEYDAISAPNANTLYVIIEAAAP